MIVCRTHRDPNQRFLFVQVAQELTTGEMAQRTLEYLRQDRRYVKGAWSRDKTGLSPGVYCACCLKENEAPPSLADECDLELQELNDPPLLFRSAEGFKIDELWPDMVNHFGSCIVAYRDFPASPPIYGDLMAEVKLDPALHDALYGRILPPGGRLYRHQAEAINAIYRGENVTVVTPTASGKTLCYLIPVLDSILKDPKATALYLAPLNALGEDQLDTFSSINDTGEDWEHAILRNPFYKHCRSVELAGRSIKVTRYDGNVESDERRMIWDIQPNIVITNPEMLHRSILSYCDDRHWKYLIQNLRFVVIDELHVYKGIFGSNFANLMRRLRRLCHYLDASPQFICASATIRNPKELAQTLTGCPHTIIDQTQDGAPRKLRRFVLWDATRSEEAINTDAKNLMQRLLGEHRVKTITFARSIPSVDAIYRYVAGDLRDRFGKDVTLVQEFKRPLEADDKRRIARDLREGRLHGVVTTTALKLGIDIGDLSAAIIVKYPGSIADVWQQAGRAGRRGEGLIFLMLDQDPLNQYFARHPEDFFEMRPEEVYVDPDNKYVLLGHLWCATRDREIDLEMDRRFFGDSLPEYLTLLDKEGKLLHEEARDVWILRDRSGFPAAEVPIRAVGFSIPILDDKGWRIGQEDTSRATRSLHKYARYSLQDDIYEVTEFHVDLQRKSGEARARKLPRPVDYITSSVSRSESNIIRSKHSRPAFCVELSFGDIEFRKQVWGYYQVPLGGRDRQARAQFQPLGPDEPPEQVFETTSAWLTLSPELAGRFDERTFKAGLRSMAKALVMAVTIQEFCDPADVDALELAHHPDTGRPTIFIHDTVAGGMGIAEQAYYDFENVFRRAYRILKECPNVADDPDHLGCPLCVTEGWGEEGIVNRPVAMAIMEEILTGDPVVERKSDVDIMEILRRRGFSDLQFVKSGGMGKIYRGRRDGQDLAIKIVNPTILGLSRAAQEGMIREGSIWKKLVHQNIVRLHEAEQAEGLLYLTMDYMPRGSLRTRIPVDGMDPVEARRIALGLARAVAYLAGSGYVHCDIKPDNILFDAADQPRLTDFEIARGLEEEFWEQPHAGVAMGTIGYQAPEQVRDRASCTGAADIFALGVVLYEMLTGGLPPRDTLGAIIEETVRDLRPVPMADLLRRMMGWAPAQRPTAAEVIGILEEL